MTHRDWDDEPESEIPIILLIIVLFLLIVF